MGEEEEFVSRLKVRLAVVAHFEEMERVVERIHRDDIAGGGLENFMDLDDAAFSSGCV